MFHDCPEVRFIPCHIEDDRFHAKALKASGVSGKLPDLAKLKADYKRLIAEKDALYTEYGKLKKQLLEYDAVKQNIDSILHPARGRGQEKSL